jgi:hypothetical protein
MPDTLRKYDPQISKLVGSDIRGTDFEDALEKAWDLVYEDINALSTRPSLVMDEKQLCYMHILKFKVLLCEDGYKLWDEVSPLDAARYFKDEYSKQFNQIIPKTNWDDKDEDLIPSASEQQFSYRILKH